MKIFSMDYNTGVITNIYKNKSKPNVTSFNIKPMPFDSVSFTSVASGGQVLKQLAQYDVPDMYSGVIMLSSKDFEKMQQDKIFDLPLKDLIPILSNYEKNLCPVQKKVYNELKRMSLLYPDVNMSEAFRMIVPLQQAKLLKLQHPIFEELIKKAYEEMPLEELNDFLDLMQITNKKIYRDPIVLPFSEREFIYKLKRYLEQIQSSNRAKETKDLKKIIKEAQKIYSWEIYEKLSLGKTNIPRNQKLKEQSSPDNFKRNAEKITYLKNLLKKSSLRYNITVNNIFDDATARVYSLPQCVPFARKSFIYDLQKITDRLPNRRLAHELIQIAAKLPTSDNEMSAFITKYANPTSDVIGFKLFEPSVCSVDHIVAVKNKGKSKLNNFGLCTALSNREKSNIYFARWCKLHPETYTNCQKYVDRLIELYKQGVFDKIGLSKSYIYDFAATIRKVSPQEKPLILDLSKLES